MDELRIVLNADEQLRVDMQDEAPLTLNLQNAEIPVVTNDYAQLDNKPQINGVTLVGNKSNTDLNMVSRTGDSVYGDLTVRSGYTFNTVSPTMDVTSAPSSGAWTQDGLRIMDKNHNGVGFLWANQYINGNVGIQIHAGRPVGGNYVFNGIALEVSPSGEMNVGVSAPKVWRQALNGVSVVTRGGTKVLGAFSSATTVATVITTAEINALIGVSDSNIGNTTVTMANGDISAYSGMVTCAFNSAIDAWQVQFSPACTNVARINWFVAYYG